jgi:hypothetical protein
MNRRHAFVLSALALVAVAGCSGGSGSMPAPRAAGPTATPIATAPPATGRQITFTIEFKKSRAKTRGVRPHYISPNTGSVGVAVNGGAASYAAVSCSEGSCQVSVTVDAPVNQTDTFVVTAWTGPDGPNDGGILLSQGSAQAFITPGATLNIPLVLGGIVNSIVAVNLSNTAFTSGIDATATITVTAKDPSGAVIVGCFASPVPVGIFENDNLQGFSLSSNGELTTGHVLSSGSTADGCSPVGGSLTLYYRGGLTGPSFPADTVVLADLPGTENTTFRFTYGDVDDYGLFYNHPDDATSALAEIMTACPSGTAGCAYYQPALAPFGADLTSLGAAQTGEPGNPVVWGADDFTGLVGAVTASGAISLFPSDGVISGPPHSPDSNDPNYSVPDDLGAASLLIPVYNDSNVWTFVDSAKSQTFKPLQPQYQGAGFAFPVGAAPSAFFPDGAGNLWFVDPTTAAIDQSTAAGGSIVSCALPFSDGSTAVSGDALAVGGSTVWASTVANLVSGGQQFFVARFPTDVVNSNPCSVPFADELPVAAEVDKLALDPNGDLWYVDNAQTLGAFTPNAKAPATQNLGFSISSNLVASGQYLYGIDSTDAQLVRIDTSALPPKASIAVAALPANWTQLQNFANDFNLLWQVRVSSGSLWFAGNVSSGLKAFTTELFNLNPAALSFGPPALPRNGRVAFAPAHALHRGPRTRGAKRRYTSRAGLPNFGF